MATVDVLGYFPKNMSDFIKFCIYGESETLGSSVVKPGIFEWLYGKGVTAAHFFTSLPNDPVQVFVATIKKSDDDDMPWDKKIGGFEKYVHLDGQLTHVTDLLPTNLNLNIRSNKALDDWFVKGRLATDRLLDFLKNGQKEHNLTFTLEKVKDTLFGEPETDLRSLRAEIEEALGSPLLEEPTSIDLTNIINSVLTAAPFK
ncbi:MAG TPA: hypothetical protein VI306_02585 [Pyrinomonadaceae bacterium]